MALFFYEQRLITVIKYYIAKSKSHQRQQACNNIMDVQPGKKNRLTLYIGIALVLGIALGFIFNKSYVGEENNKIANADIQAKHLLEMVCLLRRIALVGQAQQWFLRNIYHTTFLNLRANSPPSFYLPF